ncbi:MAG: carbon-nitrogen hydrolase [Thalassospira sp.]|nr:carbon-nitrogen hydrolase [Thalassospira sp.]
MKPHSPSPFTLGVIQMRMQPDIATNLAHALSLLDAAAAKGVQVVLLPELINAQYFCQKLDPAYMDIAEPIPGKTTDVLAAKAKQHNMVIIAPLYERAAAGLYYNSAAVLDADGTLKGVYRKMHIPHDPLFEEKYYFAPGDTGFMAFDTRYGRIGVLICWDQWFPEAARATALLGADVLLYPTAIGWHPAEKAAFGADQVTAWRTAQRAHAIASGVYVAAANRIGHEIISGDGLEFFGHSFVYDPFGRELASLDERAEGVLTALIDPRAIEDTRRNWPFRRDRRVDAYQGLLKK